MTITFPNLVDFIPPARSGTASVEHVMVGGYGYARLLIDGQCWMSDAPSERDSCVVAVEWARGHALLCGLGLGMILTPICAKAEVTSVTVIERSPDVVSLVAPHYSSPKLRVIEADAWHWTPGRLFDSVWLDIWVYPNTDEALRLAERFSPFLAPGGWLGSWNALGDRALLGVGNGA